MGVWFFKVCEFCGSYVWCLKLFHSWVCVYLFPSSFLCFWSIWLMGLMIPSFFALLCLKTIFQLSRTIMTPFLFRFELGFSHTSKALLFIFILCALLTYVWIFVLCSERTWRRNKSQICWFDWGKLIYDNLKGKWSLMCPHLWLKTVGQADIPLAQAMAMVIPLHKMALLLSMLMIMIVIAPILHHREYHPFFWRC